MTKTLVLTICLGLMMALVGCGGASNPVVGTWKLELDEKIAKMMPADQKVDATVEFKGDNTFAVKMKMGAKAQDISGNYKLDGKTLTMTATMEDGKPSSDKPETVTLADDMKSFPMPGGMGKMVKQ